MSPAVDGERHPSRPVSAVGTAPVGGTTPHPVVLLHDHEYHFASDIDTMRFFVDFQFRLIGGSGPKLGLSVYTYDDRGMYVDKLHDAGARSRDRSAVILGELDRVKMDDQAKGENTHGVRVNVHNVAASVTSMLLCLNGGPRSFNNVTGATLRVCSAPGDRGEGTFLSGAGTSSLLPLFSSSARTRRDCLDVAVCVLYKDGWDEDGKPKWAARPLFEPVFQTITRAKEVFCSQLVIGVVPCLESCRPRLFPSVRSLCTALSSEALPKLKKKFVREGDDSLDMEDFTEVLFLQLHESHPRITDAQEAAYAVAMIQELFLQIDYNGDGGASWNEFTTFLSITGLRPTNSSDMVFGSQGASGEDDLNDYTIAYSEDMTRRDHILNSQKLLWGVRHFPGMRRMAIIPTDTAQVMMVSEDFAPVTTLDVLKLSSTPVGSKCQMEAGHHSHTLVPTQSDAGKEDADDKMTVYDVVYLTGRDLYAYAASDHTITVVREQHGYGGFYFYAVHNRFLSTLLHNKLCWSKSEKVLCSVASDYVIYGWDIDVAGAPIFQVSRHSELVTDFISVENMSMFVTCSMDRRIVMWSASNRRVKAVWAQHTRGVRCLAVSESTLLSGGFDCDARTFDLFTREVVALLRGHRYPIAAVQLMCDRAATEREHRAITVDESGEFRLWNIYVKERSSDATPVPTLQSFHMHSPESPLTQFRWLCMPEAGRFCNGEYSDFIACSTKLMHFLPMKTSKGFVPPTAILYHQSSGFVVTAIGRTIVKYDVATGGFLGFFHDVSDSDITAMCEDGFRGRRLLCGNEQGRYYLINFTDGSVIDELKVHTKGIINELKIHTMEVTTLLCRRVNDITIIYSCSVDGSIAVCEERGGRLSCRYLLDHAFGPKIGVKFLEHVPTVRAVVAASTTYYWGLWDDQSLRKILCIREKATVNALRVIGASRDAEDQHIAQNEQQSMSVLHKQAQQKENLLTVAVATAAEVRVYTLDTLDVRGVVSFQLLFERDLYVSDLAMLRLPKGDRGGGGNSGCVNYPVTKPVTPDLVGLQLFASSDDGRMVSWNANELRRKSEEDYRLTYKSVFSRSRVGTPAQRCAQSRAVSRGPTRTTSPPRSPGAGGAGDGGPPTTSFPTPGGAHTAEDSLSAEEHLEMQAVNARMSDAFFQAPLALPGMKDNKRRQGLFVIDGSVTYLAPNRSWRAHTDAVTNIVSLGEHGCVMTLSMDGFHRVWSIDMECLGEMPLPNLLDDMKDAAATFDRRATGGWKFVSQRLSVMPQHQAIARHLTRKLKSSTGNPEKGLSLSKKQKVIAPLRLPATAGEMVSTSDAVISLPPMLPTPVRTTVRLAPLSGGNVTADDDDDDEDPIRASASASIHSSGGRSAHGLNLSASHHSRTALAALEFSEREHAFTAADDNDDVDPLLLSRSPAFMADDVARAVGTLSLHGYDKEMSSRSSVNSVLRSDPAKNGHGATIDAHDHDTFRSSIIQSLIDDPVLAKDDRPQKVFSKQELDDKRFRMVEQWATEQLSPQTVTGENASGTRSKRKRTRGTGGGGGGGGGGGSREALWETLDDDPRRPVTPPPAEQAARAYNNRVQRAPKAVGITSIEQLWSDIRAKSRPSSAVGSADATAASSSKPGPATRSGQEAKSESRATGRNGAQHTPQRSSAEKAGSSKSVTSSIADSNASGVKRFGSSPPGRGKQPVLLKSLKTPPHSSNKRAGNTAAAAFGTAPSTLHTPLSTARLGDTGSVGSMSSVSSLGSGGVSVTVPAIRQRRRGVDNVLPESNSSFGVDTFSKAHAADDAFSISCVTGELVSSSKWLAPAELGQATKDQKTKVQLAQPFTERSLMYSEYQPRMDAESYRILRQLAQREPDKLAGMTTASAVMALRVPARATTIKIPPLDKVRPSDAVFGPQCDLYKNAFKHLQAESRVKSSLVRHNMALHMIEDSVKRVHNMVVVLGKESLATEIFDDKFDIPDDEDDLLLKAGNGGGGGKASTNADGGRGGDDGASSAESAFGSSTAHGGDGSGSVTGGYLGSVAAGWDPEEELQTRIRLSKSAALIPPDAAMRTRALDKAALLQRVKRAEETVAAEERAVREAETGKLAPTARMAKKQSVISTASSEMLERLESKLVARVRFVLAWAMQKRPVTPKEFASKRLSLSDEPQSAAAKRASVAAKRASVAARKKSSVATATAARKRSSVATKATTTKTNAVAVPVAVADALAPAEAEAEAEAQAEAEAEAQAEQKPGSATGGDGAAKVQSTTPKSSKRTVTLPAAATAAATAAAPAAVAASQADPATGADADTDKTPSGKIKPSSANTLRVVGKDGKLVAVSNRALMPHYKVDDLSRFCEIFANADKDGEGDLDIDEWTQLLCRMDKNASAQSARLLFMSMDDNNNGTLSLNELLPVVFSKASKAQIKLMESYASVLLIRNASADEPSFPVTEADLLFDSYDPQSVNFVSIGLMRDRVRNNYKLPETVQYQFLLPLEGVSDDEMFSRQEFVRFLRNYITASAGT